MRSVAGVKNLEMQRADEDWKINPKLSTIDMMISGLKREICEEFTARLEWTKIVECALV